ncbi:DUF4450 domain-containing protein [Hymenobacter citatus]|uniref:DUF4450 domain-containing protein n=1 Tax=Hymenobacter citatus TaxID=2763506 RepID=UPI001C20C551
MPALWHNQPRTLRYHPEGQDFVIRNGTHRFTRALYGTNTAFRVEAGDLPEFALYLPGMGGNLKFGLLGADGQSKWLIESDVTARYRPGTMLYDIRDPLLGTSTLHLHVLAMSDAEGVLIEAQLEGAAPTSVQLLWAFGGATGKKFSRDGDIGADPESSFYLKPEYCQGNTFQLKANTFALYYGAEPKPDETTRYELSHTPPNGQRPTPERRKSLLGIVPPTSRTHIADATQQATPQQLWNSYESNIPTLGGLLPPSAPVLVGAIPATAKALYFAVQKAETAVPLRYAELPQAWAKAETARAALAGRVHVSTPDPYINTLGGALGIAADAIWESPTYLHGSVAWRMRLPGWRGPYVADPLGWHDRAQTHFRAYAKSQLTTPAGPVVMDTTLNLARSLEKLGTSVYSDGYIARNPNGDARPHHYDMNLVYIDELLRHLRWTGDLAFAREVWPVLERHLAWEKRNFDPDNDGLYDAYAAIWASDALQYSGGAVTHSSAYNYWSNKMAAELAAKLGKDPQPYQVEAAKIKQALQRRLWMPDRGWYAEYQDAQGLRQLHPSAGLWTIYHALDSEVPDPFQAYQSLRYIDTQIPHIPVRAEGLPDAGYYLLSTTNWQPYDWSINNVALAEVLHTTLANWQAGRSEEAFLLWKSALLESMYLGSSPGNFQQVSFYDAHRGELYRDFADPIGMAARSLVEGLFGIRPDALNGTLTIRPGLPAAWDSAALTVPDVAFAFRRAGQQETYTITPHFTKPLQLRLQLPARAVEVAALTVNGRPTPWRNLPDAVGQPVIEVDSPLQDNYVVKIRWAGDAPEAVPRAKMYRPGSELAFEPQHATIGKVFDSQGALRQLFVAPAVADNASPGGAGLLAHVPDAEGSRTAFVQLQQGSLTWWAPLAFDVKADGMASASATSVRKLAKKVTATYDPIDLTPYFNDQVTNIFQPNKYQADRPVGPTLQLPTQGIGNWCYPLTQAVIDDAGLRRLAGAQNQIMLPGNVPLRTPGGVGEKNVLFVSQWRAYPDSATVPLQGKARHAQLLLAGSTNPMQSQLTNGAVVVRYTDGTRETLALRNPDNWWPIEQDYLQDGFAFQTYAPRPYRLHLKTGLLTNEAAPSYTSIKGFSTRAIEGGAATILDLPLNPKKKLRSLTVQALANDVVIGLMGVTLVRK